MATFGQIYTLENNVFKAYAFYSTILAVKIFAMALATALCRFSKYPRVFSSPEDAVCFKGKVFIDADVERIRRAHLNDLENIIPFWMLGFLFIATNPSMQLALLCFRTFTAIRIAHSIAYIFAIRQPVRAVLFMVGVLVNMFMAYINFTHFISYQS